ncbi:hypothetical protein JHK82_014244 [Glycine max]|nr:hypothetical protein JHK87_014154 [Glycine soja]KAG5030638.1 hypothetical protein JHK85_014620 [Glycine max]KAG5044865.1 hypothetical protein JHK86_014271 [Glycine max]KAG5147363.1 hypothetical protein JHK82_014244 [Glycine max]KHN22260.1 hypothetical protein glysoja_022016 [Glycine soja]
MLAGSVTLKWSSSNNDDFDSTIHEDLDVLDVGEREKVVRHMWDAYSRTHTKSVGLPKFWWEAFEAAYEQLMSDVPAVSEIAKMSLRSLPLQIQSHSV